MAAELATGALVMYQTKKADERYPCWLPTKVILLKKQLD
jgi:hypothetical protein